MDTRLLEDDDAPTVENDHHLPAELWEMIAGLVDASAFPVLRLTSKQLNGHAISALFKKQDAISHDRKGKLSVNWGYRPGLMGCSSAHLFNLNSNPSFDFLHSSKATHILAAIARRRGVNYAISDAYFQDLLKACTPSNTAAQNNFNLFLLDTLVPLLSINQHEKLLVEAAYLNNRENFEPRLAIRRGMSGLIDDDYLRILLKRTYLPPGTHPSFSEISLAALIPLLNTDQHKNLLAAALDSSRMDDVDVRRVILPLLKRGVSAEKPLALVSFTRQKVISLFKSLSSFSSLEEPCALPLLFPYLTTAEVEIVCGTYLHYFNLLIQISGDLCQKASRLLELIKPYAPYFNDAQVEVMFKNILEFRSYLVAQGLFIGEDIYNNVLLNTKKATVESIKRKITAHIKLKNLTPDTPLAIIIAAFKYLEGETFNLAQDILMAAFADPNRSEEITFRVEYIYPYLELKYRNNLWQNMLNKELRLTQSSIENIYEHLEPQKLDQLFKKILAEMSAVGTTYRLPKSIIKKLINDLNQNDILLLATATSGHSFNWFSVLKDLCLVLPPEEKDSIILTLLEMLPSPNVEAEEITIARGTILEALKELSSLLTGSILILVFNTAMDRINDENDGIRKSARSLILSLLPNLPIEQLKQLLTPDHFKDESVGSIVEVNLKMMQTGVLSLPGKVPDFIVGAALRTALAGIELYKIILPRLDNEQLDVCISRLLNWLETTISGDREWWLLQDLTPCIRITLPRMNEEHLRLLLPIVCAGLRHYVKESIILITAMIFSIKHRHYMSRLLAEIEIEKYPGGGYLMHMASTVEAINRSLQPLGAGFYLFSTANPASSSKAIDVEPTKVITKKPFK